MEGAADGATGDELTVLVAMYEQYRQEVRAHGKRKSRRYLGAFTILGLIGGYIFSTQGDFRILVVIPYVLAFLYLSHISSMDYVVQLAALLAIIESKLNVVGAEYEFYHGGFNVASSPRFEDLSGFEHGSGEYQDAVKSRVRNLMNILAVVAYFVPSITGVVLFAVSGIPEVGVSAIHGGTPTTVAIASMLFLSHLLLFHQVKLAWDAYQDHTELLSAGVTNAVSNGEGDPIQANEA